MSSSNDPDWGRSKPRSAGVEIAIVLLSLCAVVWGMVESINYGRELGRPIGLVGFIELWFREVVILVLAVVVALTVLFVRLWRLVQGVFGETRDNVRDSE